jgi:hypothetical protein
VKKPNADIPEKGRSIVVRASGPTWSINARLPAHRSAVLIPILSALTLILSLILSRL